MCDKMASKRLPETRLLLVGKTGSGKSSTGNSILGDKVFKTLLSFSSSTLSSTYEERTRYDRRLVVVDTPGFYDTVKTNQDIVREIAKVFGYLNNGFHAMLYVINTERFTQESIKTKKLFFRTFGEDVRKYTIIVLTHYDEIREAGITNVESYVKSAGQELTTFIKTCDNRLVAFNNKAKGLEMENQVKTLLGVVDKVVKDNYSNVYTNFHFRLVRAFTRIERKNKRKDLKKARENLFNQAVRTLNMERMVTWDVLEDRPMRLKSLEQQSELQKSAIPTQRKAHTTSKKIKAVSVRVTSGHSLKSKSATTVTTEEIEELHLKSIESQTPNAKAELELKSSDRKTSHTKTVATDNTYHDTGECVDEVTASLDTVDLQGDEIEARNWHDEDDDEDHEQEQRKDIKDANVFKRLVDFITVFIEKLIP